MIVFIDFFIFVLNKEIKLQKNILSNIWEIAFYNFFKIKKVTG